MRETNHRFTPGGEKKKKKLTRLLYGPTRHMSYPKPITQPQTTEQDSLRCLANKIKRK